MFRFLKKIGSFLTALRNLLVNGVFLLFLLFIAAALMEPEEEPLPDKAPLYLDLSGVLVDQLSPRSFSEELFSEDQRSSETLVRDVVSAIRRAHDDERITAIILDLNYLYGGGLSKLEEIGQALEYFKTSGKPTLAYADNYSQAQYYLASYADTIYLNQMGNLMLTGFGMYRNYMKDAADKLALKFHVFRVGDYKDAVEPYIRNDMSKASREHNTQWISELWGRYTSKIEALRQLPSGAIENYINDLPNTMADASTSGAQIALNAGLVDKLVTRVEMNALLQEQFGSTDDDSFVAVDHNHYLDQTAPASQGKNTIGLIAARGTILDGHHAEGDIGSDSLSALIRQATHDDSLKALVIRVDSGGGSAFASEVIRQELVSARAQGLPIYISMGSVAASGGYWISSIADEIWATPSTITGSIGVWGLIPNVSETFNKIGIHSDGIGTTALADIAHPERELSPQAKRVIQGGVNNIYHEFLQLVADARDSDVDSIHQIAQGRVWTGETALQLGLVDQLGYLQDVIAAAGEKYAPQGYRVKVIERKLSAKEQFLRALMEQTNAVSKALVRAAIGENWAQLLTAEVPGAALIKPRSSAVQIFAHCLSCDEI